MNKRTDARFTLKEISSSLPPEKKRADGTVTRFFHRPLSFPLSVLFLNAGLTPNTVTYLSILACAAALVCTLFPFVSLHYAAVALYLLFGTLDCADGNMARALRNRKKTGPKPAVATSIPAETGPNMGEWVDALGGYCAYACIVLSLGLSSALVAPLSLPGTALILPWSNATWILVAAVASAANLLMRLAFQSWRAASGDASRSSIGGEKRFSEEIGITGWFQILYALGLFTGTLPWLLLAYTAVYAGGCAVTVLKLVIRVEKAAKTAR